MAGAGIRDAVVGDAEQVGKLITELGHSTTFEAIRDRLAMRVNCLSNTSF